MTIYQLHECGGEWEDYRDYIIGSYLRKERAEEEKAKAEAKEKELIEQSNKCGRCPFETEDFDKLDDLLVEYSDYCDKAVLRSDFEGCIYCENCYSHWDEMRFYIEEVEVEE